MLYHLLVPLADETILFNVFRYTSFRMAWALITTLGLCYVAYPAFIKWMRGRKMAQIIREDGPQGHLETKVGIPTMGGLPMLGAIGVSSLTWCRLDVPLVWMTIIVLLGYGGIGLLDDWLKLTHQSSEGLRGRWKIVGQVGIGGGVFGYGLVSGVVEPAVTMPFLKDTFLDFSQLWSGAPDLSWLYVGLAVFILVGASNAVNLTDGLDGLAIGPVMTSAATYGIIAYLAGHAVFSEYLAIPHVSGASELSVICMSMVGAGLGFLWYNAYPAQIFMGDVGSLGLGGGIGALALLTRQELLLALVGGIFVLEAVSVILQVGSYKLRKKRIFAMAPIHHHYEKKGWSEPKIIVRFWIISILLALVALSTLKLR